MGFAGKKHHKSTLDRIRMVRALTERYYEAGNNRRCYKAVWKRYICPVYPMCYRTYLNYLGVTTEARKETKATPVQLSLFDFFDNHKDPRNL